MADTVRYNQSQLMFGDLEIVCGGFKTSFKTDTEDLTATNSSSPYDTSFGNDTIEAEASDVDPALRKQLKRLWENQTRDTLSKLLQMQQSLKSKRQLKTFLKLRLKK